MIALLNLPGWLSLVPLVLLLLAGLAAIYFSPPADRRPLFIGLGVAAVAWVGVLVARGAYQRGKADCDAAHVEAQRVWRETYDARRAEHAAKDEGRRDTYERAATPIRERIYYEAARPGACRHTDDAERLLDDQKRAANRQISAAAGGAVQATAGRAEGDGAERPGK